LNQIIGFDETSFYMDAPGSYTIAKKGSKRTAAKTTGKEKTRLSCLMTATASGKKLPIVCVVPRKKRINGIDLPENALVVYDTNGNLSQIFKL
jgi:hypothetical protein